MKQKKIHSTITVGIMLMAVALAVIPTAEAASIQFTCDGYVYVNDVIMEPDQVILRFPGKDYTATLWPDGYYVITEEENVGDIGIFLVTVYGKTYTANETITLKQGTFAYVIDLHVEIVNLPPNAPTLVAPSPSGKTGVSINPALSVSVSDPEGDTMTVTFYDDSDDSEIDTKTGVTNGTTTVTWSGRAYSTTYSWYAIANDGQDSPQSDTWNFTTRDKPEEPGPPGPPGPSPPSGNNAPTADAGGPYVGTEGEEITFDGSDSSDSDGDVVEYRWDFENDDIWDTDWSSSAKASHTYSTAGDYTVKLWVKDDDGDTDTDTANVAISQFNFAPTTPDVSGPKTGDVDTDYDYTAVSTDADNDTIKYMFDWDDGTNTTTELVENGTEVTETHNWSSYGFYTVSVTAYDNQNASSGTRQYVVAIDVMWVKDIGYLIDNNSDGTYNLFYSNETMAQTDTEKQTDGTYLINSDEDDEWDWIYDPDTDTLTAYSAPSEPEEEDYTWLYILLIIVIIILLLIAVAAAGRKKKKKPKKPEKPEK